MSQLCPAAFGARAGERGEWSGSRGSGAAAVAGTAGEPRRLPPDFPLGSESGGGGLRAGNPLPPCIPKTLAKQQDEVSGVFPVFRNRKTCELKKGDISNCYLILCSIFSVLGTLQNIEVCHALLAVGGLQSRLDHQGIMFCNKLIPSREKRH